MGQKGTKGGGQEDGRESGKYGLLNRVCMEMSTNLLTFHARLFLKKV